MNNLKITLDFGVFEIKFPEKLSDFDMKLLDENIIPIVENMLGNLNEKSYARIQANRAKALAQLKEWINENKTTKNA